jgi:hypothetical protein
MTKCVCAKDGFSLCYVILNVLNSLLFFFLDRVLELLSVSVSQLEDVFSLSVRMCHDGTFFFQVLSVPFTLFKSVHQILNEVILAHEVTSTS